MEGISKNFKSNFIDFIRKYGYIFLGFIILISAIFIRVKYLDFVSNDLKSFIFNWYQQIYENGYKALGFEIGDYTPAYMYLLYFISLCRVAPNSIELVYAIKFISIFFEFLTVIILYLIIKNITKNNIKSTLFSFAYLFIPTIFFNSSYWGQCDSIYVFFIVLSVYFLLNNKQRSAYISLGISFSFKLQTVFILPLFALLILDKKIKFRYIIYIPLVYVLFAIPSVICGRSFINIMTIYFNQAANSYKQLTLNCPTLYILFFDNFETNDLVSFLGVIFTALSIGTLILMMFKFKSNNNKEKLILIAYFYSLVVPFVMPHMHERYFYLADVLCILYMALNIKKFYLPLITMFTSLSGYLLYLFGYPLFSNPNTTLRVCALLNLVVICVLGVQIFTKNDKNCILDKH